MIMVCALILITHDDQLLWFVWLQIRQFSYGNVLFIIERIVLGQNHQAQHLLPHLPMVQGRPKIAALNYFIIYRKDTLANPKIK